MKHSPAYRIAATILHGFDEYRSRFKQITADASRRFRDAAWRDAQQASAERINLYEEKVQDTLERLRRTFPADELTHCECWREAKNYYAETINQRLDYELAETFFNSMFCSIFHHRHIRNDWMFVYSSRVKAAHHSGLELCRRIRVGGDWEAATQWALVEAPFETPFVDMEGDTRLAGEFLSGHLPQAILEAEDAEIELIKSVFYRNKGAYLVGRIKGGGEQVPLVLPVLHEEGVGLHLDTVLIEPDEVSIIFSFTRAYFQVKVQVPGEFVEYLKELMPGKPEGELYAAIGFFKHGKTEFFRALNRQVARREDQFIIAPGVRGMVMAVFVLPSFRTVFKIIKDRFDPTKEMSHENVRDKYRMVKRHDRVGRMADTQEFSHFIARKDHFDPECLAHLLEVAPSTVYLKGDKVIIEHCYTERMMTPLNMYIEQCDETEMRAVLKEYGNAIKQMAAANIFPGDMLLKNFGVTRHGRVVFYDYDEVCYLTECNFRHIPEPLYPEQELSDEPWYSVGPNDIFPEEFGPFLFAKIRLRKLFYELHPELLDADYWKGVQQAIRDGRVIDVYPYRNKQRFSGGDDNSLTY
ncbi:bifunctional isocitrate dehydrogenase kinase/phosphatase [Halomonas urumqiensis]|uniref:Isocitrate dehydrogenase kinase/phosphatase n=1 Tax=Halomonas urumqiensis TaxID=1684789 RepID=A0A2N7UEY5_9GAMM|nr:bifunctional isocitrate dehydrogenase kinase/phosphatase [Halomonas urumqiensis]PMR79018.1 bifunctional isocitrate dehydrogenase kinase/phosphatase [Halomonas urumqiensis]PTB01012.1 bifunctional isocitrate dehydrogenase kinase/phosphatase [Halomonas urumqiensis]GHE22957.1 isocitrate dehydrogenase kinase/phosphatase [Halomonas urumqiensis]